MTKIWRPIVYIRQKAQCFSKTVYFHDKDNTAVQSERVYFSTRLTMFILRKTKQCIIVYF